MSGETATKPVETKEKDKPGDQQKPGDQKLRDEGYSQTRPADQQTPATADQHLPPVTVGDNSQPKPDAPAPRKLNDETIKQYANELHGAVNETGFLGRSTPNTTKIFQLLDSLGEADRKALEEAYKNADKNGDHRSLREELQKKLDGDDWRKAEAKLNTRDGRTNDAGNLMVSLSAINDNRGDAERRVIETFATLNADQRKKLYEDFQKDYGMSVDDALKKYDVSGDAMKALGFINKPIEQRTAAEIQDFARFAIDKKNLDYLSIALRGDTPAAKEARQNLQGDEEFKKKLVDAFKPDDGAWGVIKKIGDVALGPLDEIVSGVINGDLSFGKVLGGIPFMEALSAVDAKEENYELLVAMDILREGRPSLATIALNNTGSIFGWFDNKDNIKLAVDNATDSERQMFTRGRELVGKNPNELSPEDKNAQAYYDRVHKSFEDAGDDRETASWEAKLLYGKDSLEAKIAGTDKKNDRFSAIENMTEQEWNALKDPNKRKDFEQFIGRFMNEDEKRRMLELVDGKTKSESFAKSQEVRRSLSEVIEHNKNDGWFSTSFDGKNIVGSMEKLSPDEAKRYKEDAAFRADIDKFVKEKLNPEERRYAEHMLRQVQETGKPPEQDAIGKVLSAATFNGNDNKIVLTAIEEALQKDPELRKRLSGDINTLSPSERALRETIDSTLNKAIFNSPEFQATMYAGEGAAYAQNDILSKKQTELYKHIWETGRLPVDVKADLGIKNQSFFAEAAKATPEERERLLKSNNLSKEEKQLIQKVAEQGGEMKIEDRMRSFILGDGSQVDQFKEELRKMSAEEKQQLKERYVAKYGSAMEDDFLGKVDEKQRQLYKNLLTPGELDYRQDYYDNLEQWLKSRSGGGLAPDGTAITVERALTDQAALHEWVNSRFEKLDPKLAEAASAYFTEALEQHKESKAKLAEMLATVAITAAALAATPFTGGASLALVASIAFVAGGVAKVAIHRAIEGGDYDWNKALGQFFGGGTEAALNFVGGKIVEGMFKGFNVVGGQLAGSLMSKGLIAEGSEVTANRAFMALVAQGKNVTDDGLAAFVKAVAPGADEATANSIKAFARQAVTENYDAILNRTTQVVLSGVDNAIVGGGSGAAMTIVQATIDGRPLSADEILQATLAGAVTGAVMGTVIRGAIEGREIYIQSKKLPTGEHVIVPAPEGQPPVVLEDANGVRRTVTTETTPKPGERIVDGPQSEPHPTGEQVDKPVTRVGDVEPVGANDNITPQSVELKPGQELRLHDTNAKVTGTGTLEISGKSPQIEINVPEGQTMRLIVRDGDPNIRISPESKGDIEIFMDNGQELPASLRDYANANRDRVQMLERGDLKRPVGEGFEPVRTFDPVELKQRTADLEARLRTQNQPIDRQQFRDLFDGKYDMGDGPPRNLTAEERAIAMELMQESSINLNSRNVDAQLKALGDELKARGEKGPITVYVADGASDGNALAHLFKKNTGIDIEIKTLNGPEGQALRTQLDAVKAGQQRLDDATAALDRARSARPKDPEAIKAAVAEKDAANKALNGKGGLTSQLPKSSMVLDDLASLPADQRELLARLSQSRNLTVSDVGGFSRGLNMYDFATTGLTGTNANLKEKMADIIREAQAIKKANPGMTDEQAVQAYLRRGNSDALAEFNPGDKLHPGAEDPSARLRRENMDRAGYDGDQRIEALYDHATQPMVTKDELNAYLADIDREFQAANARRKAQGLEPLPGTSADYQTAALAALERNAHFNDYPTMVSQMRKLDDAIKADLARSGLGENDYIIVTGLEKDGSSYLVNHLYGKTNGVPSDRFISMDQLRALADDPAKAQEIIGKKRLVFLDDYRNSGRQQAELIRDAQNNVLSRLKGTDGNPLVTDVTVAALARHELPATSADPFLDFGAVTRPDGTTQQVLVHARPQGGNVDVAPGQVRVHSIIGENYVNIADEGVLSSRGFDAEMRRRLNELGQGSVWDESPVATGIVTPYGMPNNNPNYLQFGEGQFGIPKRYKKPVEIFPTEDVPVAPRTTEPEVKAAGDGGDGNTRVLKDGTTDGVTPRTDLPTTAKPVYDRDGLLTQVIDEKTGMRTEYTYETNPATGEKFASRIDTFQKTLDASGRETLVGERSFILGADGQWRSQAPITGVGNVGLGRSVEMHADGSVTFKDSSFEPGRKFNHSQDTVVGRSRYYDSPQTALDSVTIRPDGTRINHYADNASVVTRADGLVTEMTNASGVVTKFDYDANSMLSKMEVGNKTYVRHTDGMWYDQTPSIYRTTVNRMRETLGMEASPGKPFAKEITMEYDGYRIVPVESVRMPARPNDTIESIKQNLDGRSSVSYTRTLADVDGIPTTPNPKRPTELEVMNQRVERGEVIQQPDGTYIHKNADGYEVVYDGSGTVTRVKTVDGREIRSGFATDGTPNVIEIRQNGRVTEQFYKHKDGQFWYTLDAQGQPTWYRDVRMEPDGSITKLNYSKDSHFDWEGVKERPDGLKVEVDSLGRERVGPQELARERSRVEMLQKKILQTPEEQARFSKLLNEFETQAQARGLSAEEIANTYYQLDRLLSSPDALLDAKTRALVAQQFLLKGAHPHKINQGQFNTCNVTADVEHRLMVSSPSDILRMTTDVATTGRFIAADGSIIDMSHMKNMLTPFGQAGELGKTFDGQLFTDITVDGKRDFFDQIVQSTSIETFWQRQSINPSTGQRVRPATRLSEVRQGVDYRPGDLRYELGPGVSDTGEFIADYSTNPPQRLHSWQSVTTLDPITGQRQTVSELLPTKSPNLVGNQMHDIGEQITGLGEPKHYFAKEGLDHFALGIKDTDQLVEKLREASDKQRMPITVLVDSRDPLISGRPSDGGYGGAHVINVQRIYQEDGKWFIDYTNQWGQSANRTKVPAADLMRAMELRKPTELKPPVGKVRQYAPWVVGGAVVGAGALATGYYGGQLLQEWFGDQR